MVARYHAAGEQLRVRSFSSNYVSRFLKLIDVNGSCDSLSYRKYLIVYRFLRVPPNGEEMFALVGGSALCTLAALHRIEARRRVAHYFL